jgi:anti-sigma B factor antagonist
MLVDPGRRRRRMEIKVRQEGSVTVVDLSGAVTLGRGDTVLRGELFRLLEEGHKQIVINLREVSHFDSAALGELGATYKAARQRDAELKLLTPPPKLGELLRLVKFDEVFDVHYDEAEAIRAFGGTPRGDGSSGGPLQARIDSLDKLR